MRACLAILASAWTTLFGLAPAAAPAPLDPAEPAGTAGLEPELDLEARVEVEVRAETDPRDVGASAESEDRGVELPSSLRETETDRLFERLQRPARKLETSELPESLTRWNRGISDTLARLARAPDVTRVEDLPFRESSERPTLDVSGSWFVNEFVFEMERNFADQAHDLLDEDSVLNGSRLFGERWGSALRRPLADRESVEQMTAEERVILRSGVEAMKETVSQTDAFQFLYRRVQDVEVYFNWSLVHTSDDYSHVVKLLSSEQEEDGGGVEVSKRRIRRSDIVSKIDSRFRLASLVDAPDRVFQLRGKFLRHVHFSLYPMSKRFEISTVLYRDRGCRVGLTYTEDRDSGRMLVAGLTAGF